MAADPKPLNRHDLHIINAALALLEAEVDSGDKMYADSALPAVRRVRARVFEQIRVWGGYDPKLGIRLRKDY